MTNAEVFMRSSEEFESTLRIIVLLRADKIDLMQIHVDHMTFCDMR
jgi:hypothetical protein